MTKITLSLEDSKVKQLRDKAESYGLKLEQFVSASIEDLISQPEPEFDAAFKKILSKNKELYKRLT